MDQSIIDENDLPACRPGRLPAGFAQSAEKVQRALLDHLESALAKTLETSVDTALLPTEQSTFGGFLEEHQAAGCLLALDLAPLNGCAVLSFSRDFLFRVLDIFTATPAIVGADQRETVTAIELHILQEVFDLFAEALRNTWQPLYPLTFDVVAVGLEKGSEAAAKQAAETAVVLKSRVRIGESDAGIDIALPGFLFRLAESQARQNAAADAVVGRVEGNLMEALGESLIDVESVLNGSGVRMSELLGIRPGQILSLGTPPDAVFECLVSGKPRFKGEMMASGGRQAFRIESRTGAGAN